MLDPTLLRTHPETVKANLARRNIPGLTGLVDEFLDLDRQWRELTQLAEKLRAERNMISRRIAELKKAGQSAAAELQQAASIPKQITHAEERQQQVATQRDALLYRIPNMLHHSVPDGNSEEDNATVKLVGKKPKFSFPVQSHVDVLEKLKLADLERAAKIAGARFWFLTGDLARLDLALQHYALAFMAKRGFTAVKPPLMMSRKAYEGVTDLGDFASVMYKIEEEDLYLIATSEHPLTAMFMDETLEERELPKKLAGISSCFRKEAGAHGKDTKGIFRGHQFDKIEQVVLCAPEQSWKLHEELIKNAVEFFSSLGLHFRVINICTADIGTIAAKKYDIEVWIPAQQTYREVVSCSNCTDYQSRRLKIRYRTPDGNKLVHTLNSTCVATSRALVAIIENFQDAKGNIHIPKVLQPYMGGQQVIGASPQQATATRITAPQRTAKAQKSRKRGRTLKRGKATRSKPKRAAKVRRKAPSRRKRW